MHSMQASPELLRAAIWTDRGVDEDGLHQRDEETLLVGVNNGRRQSRAVTLNP